MENNLKRVKPQLIKQTSNTSPKKVSQNHVKNNK